MEHHRDLGLFSLFFTPKVTWRSFRGQREKMWGSFRGLDHFRVGTSFIFLHSPVLFFYTGQFYFFTQSSFIFYIVQFYFFTQSSFIFYTVQFYFLHSPVLIATCERSERAATLIWPSRTAHLYIAVSILDFFLARDISFYEYVVHRSA